LHNFSENVNFQKKKEYKKQFISHNTRIIKEAEGFFYWLLENFSTHSIQTSNHHHGKKQ